MESDRKRETEHSDDTSERPVEEGGSVVGGSDVAGIKEAGGSRA